VVSVTGDRAPVVKAGDVVMRIDARYFRPAEVEALLGNEAKALLDWTPQTSTREMCVEMIEADLAAVRSS